jgi:hypothetical protein
VSARSKDMEIEPMDGSAKKWNNVEEIKAFYIAKREPLWPPNTPEKFEEGLAINREEIGETVRYQNKVWREEQRQYAELHKNDPKGDEAWSMGKCIALIALILFLMNWAGVRSSDCVRDHLGGCTIEESW